MVAEAEAVLTYLRRQKGLDHRRDSPAKLSRYPSGCMAEARAHSRRPVAHMTPFATPAVMTSLDSAN